MNHLQFGGDSKYLSHLCMKIIPQYYKNEIAKTGNEVHDIQWQYFLLGSSALAVAFAPHVVAIDKPDSSSTSTCGSSCGSSCSSCGGCGGD